MITLKKYSRRDLSNFLQLAQQAQNAGFPLPCFVVEQVIEAHDRLLRHYLAKKASSANAPKKTPQVAVYQKNGNCNKHGDKLQLMPCGKGLFCPSCHDDIFGIKS